MDDLPCYVEGQTVDSNNYDGDDSDYEEEEISEDVSPSIKSDALANGIKGDANTFGRATHCLPQSPKPSEKCDRTTFSATPSSCSDQDSSAWLRESSVDSLRPLSPLEDFPDEAPNDSLLSPLVGGEEHSFRWLQENCVKTQPSPLRSSNNTGVRIDSQLPSPVPGSKKHSFCSDDRSFTCFGASGSKRLRQSSHMRCSNSEVQTTDCLLRSPEGNVINLSTPSSCIVGKCNKRATVYSEIIDLTDSPVIIQL